MVKLRKPIKNHCTAIGPNKCRLKSTFILLPRYVVLIGLVIEPEHVYFLCQLWRNILIKTL